MDRNSRRGPLPADLFTRYDDDPVRADWEVFGRRAAIEGATMSGGWACWACGMHRRARR